jgi:hypothetical protein
MTAHLSACLSEGDRNCLAQAGRRSRHQRYLVIQFELIEDHLSRVIQVVRFYQSCFWFRGYFAALIGSANTLISSIVKSCPAVVR